MMTESILGAMMNSTPSPVSARLVSRSAAWIWSCPIASAAVVATAFDGSPVATAVRISSVLSLSEAIAASVNSSICCAVCVRYESTTDWASATALSESAALTKTVTTFEFADAVAMMSLRRAVRSSRPSSAATAPMTASLVTNRARWVVYLAREASPWTPLYRTLFCRGADRPIVARTWTCASEPQATAALSAVSPTTMASDMRQ